MRLPTKGLHSEGWDEYLFLGAPRFDVVFTVCDQPVSCDEFSSEAGPLGLPGSSNAQGDDEQWLAAFEPTRQAIGIA